VAGDYRDLIRERFPQADRPGEIVDEQGTVVGEHAGTTGFTIGQRRGLGVAFGEPRFVLDVEPMSGRVVIGPREALLVAGCSLQDVSWVAGGPPLDAAVSVQLRYRSRPIPARVTEASDGFNVWFDEPQEAVAPGQAGVLYRGDEVLGGGTITGALREVHA
jgi:tRNA-specific 2-thiouridylase